MDQEPARRTRRRRRCARARWVVGAPRVLVFNSGPDAHLHLLEKWVHLLEKWVHLLEKWVRLLEKRVHLLEKRALRHRGAAAWARMKTSVQRIREFAGSDCEDLCQATEEAIIDGLGFDWLKPPGRKSLESYWRGVLLVPERELFVARLDETIVGTAQLVKPSRSNEAAAFNTVLTTFFVTPWARGHGLARRLLAEVETWAGAHGFKQISLDVRASQDAAIALYESAGYVRWGVKPKYALVDRQYIAGNYYVKELAPRESKKGARKPARAARSA